MLTLVLKFNYFQVKIISVADGINTDDESSKLGIQIRGLVNELYLDDLRKKTMRGLEGQKLRGFSAGERVYGYLSKPVGEIKLNRRGQAKYEGMVHRINPEEAEIVKRIFREFMDGKSINKIASQLNEEKIPTKKGMVGGWNISTLAGILKNKKYIGVWDWRRFKNIRDPMTGKRKKVDRSEKEIIPIFREDLVIIDQDTWDKAQKHWLDLNGTWPVSPKKKRFYQQKSYVHTSPTHLLSGLMKCHGCGGAIVLISGKGSGYYGCYNGRRKTCQNTLLIPRAKIESAIVKELRERILTAENLEYVYKNVEKKAAEGLNEVPELVKKKQAQIDKIKQEIHNYLNFVKAGNLSKAVADALGEAEKRNEVLEQEIGSLEFQKQNSFKAPPREWIDYRLKLLRETLNKNTEASSLALKEILSPITLEPVMSEEEDMYGVFKNVIASSPPAEAPRNDRFKPYYVAHTKIQSLALLDDMNKNSGASVCGDSPCAGKSSNWYNWRSRCVLIRNSITNKSQPDC